MASEENASRKAPSPLGPLLFSLALLAGIVVCLYVLWTRHAAMQGERLSSAEARYAALRSEETTLNALLGLSPCEAKARLGVLTPAAGQGEKPWPETRTPAHQGLTPAAGQGEKPDAAVPQAQQAPPSPVQEAPAQAVPAGPAAVENACVFVVSADGQQRLSTGSGFFVAPGVVVTNNHVVAHAVGKILVTSKALGRPALGHVVATAGDAGRDYAIVRVEMPEGSSAGTLAFAAGARRTDKVGAWGFPDIVGKNDPAYRRLLTGEDLSAVPELSYTEGVVSALLERTPPLIVHTAPISPGNSGGPLVNDAGEVVGINTMITLDEDSYRQASIALSGKDLLAFLQKHGIAAQAR